MTYRVDTDLLLSNTSSFVTSITVNLSYLANPIADSSYTDQSKPSGTGSPRDRPENWTHHPFPPRDGIHLPAPLANARQCNPNLRQTLSTQIYAKH